MTIPTNNTLVIKLSKEGARALNLAPSDNKLIELLNSESNLYIENKPLILKWLIIQVLGSYGYKFEV